LSQKNKEYKQNLARLDAEREEQEEEEEKESGGQHFEFIEQSDAPNVLSQEYVDYVQEQEEQKEELEDIPSPVLLPPLDLLHSPK